MRFDSKQKPRNYLSQPEQRRLLLLVAAFGLVIVLMNEVRDPKRWEWIAPDETSPSESLSVVGTSGQPAPAIDPRPSDEAPIAGIKPSEENAGKAKETVAEPGSAERFFSGVIPEHLEAIRDNTTFRPSEREAWFNLLGILLQTEQTTLREHSTGSVTYAQLLQQSDDYRGELVTMRGTIHRVNPIDMPENTLGPGGTPIKQYYRAWLSPTSNRPSPVIIYTIELPEGFPQGMEVSADVEVTGFYFKRWAYNAADQIRTAPTLLAKTLDWPPGPTPIAPRSTDAVETPPRVSTIDPRDLFRQYGIDDSQFERLVDGKPLDNNETEVLLRLLFHVQRFSTWDIESWASELPLASRLQADEGSLPRGQFFRIEGRVVDIERLSPLPETAERYELSTYYRCDIVCDSGQRAVVYARHIPKAWTSLDMAGASRKLDEPVSADAAFLKLGSEDPEAPLPVLVANRIAWHPEGTLGGLKMDVGLLDEVVDRQPLRGADREAFYQLLAAVGRAEPGQLATDARDRLTRSGQARFSVVPLFMQTEARRGELVTLRANARRVTRIRVDDPDIVARFGIDHYYEMAVFADDSEGHPLFFCVRELPEGMPIGDHPKFSAQVQVTGFLLKMWGYRTQKRDGESGEPQAQLAPLLVGECTAWYPPKSSESGASLAFAVGLTLVVGLLAICLGVWRWNRAADRSRRHVREMQEQSTRHDFDGLP